MSCTFIQIHRRNLTAFFCLLLSACFLFLHGEGAVNCTYYVTHYSNHSNCPPNETCETLKHYQQVKTFKTHYGDCAHMIVNFLKGVHDALESTITIQFCCQLNLELIGLGPREEVVIKNFESRIITGSLQVQNITFHGKYLITYKSITPDSPSRPVNILNCKFIEFKLIFTDVHLSVEHSEFHNSSSTAMTLYSSFASFSHSVSFINNTGNRGGAIALIGSTVIINSSTKLVFEDNHAYELGGAMYINNAELNINLQNFRPHCFYILTSRDSNYHLIFIHNTAVMGGDHLFGVRLQSDCVSVNYTCNNQHSECFSYGTFHKAFQFKPSSNSSSSAVSSNPSRVCLCNENNQPQCADLLKVFVTGIDVHPGELFTIAVVVVGGDFGTTRGNVHTHFVDLNRSTTSTLGYNQTSQEVSQNTKCTNLEYSLFSGNDYELLSITTQENRSSSTQYENYTDIKNEVKDSIMNYNMNGIIDTLLLHVPIFVNVTLLSCPLGLRISNTYPQKCDCHPALKVFDSITCCVIKGSSYIEWHDLIWIGKADNNSFLVASYCSTENCISGKKQIDLLRDSDTQCTFNHSGILCGGCKEGYTSVLGSSDCSYCPNNNNLALIIFFAAAGPLLVLVISVLNLTVTLGTINGLIFYANIIWAYQIVFFPSETKGLLLFFKPFIAWLNLDLGIKVCFFIGLNAFGKALLQYTFSFYTAILFLLGLRFSSKLSKYFGSRSVPTLATLLFLSYTKLLRTIISGLQLARLVTYQKYNGKTGSLMVWAVDGNQRYGHFPHIFILLAALACLFLLWIPYTFLLFSMQWLRKIDHYWPLRYIAKYKPIYDAYYAPIQDRHHYWFGLLLLAKGILLLVSSFTLHIIIELSLFLLLVTALVLLWYLNHIQVYKKKYVTLLESSFLANVIILTAGFMYCKGNLHAQETLLCVSIAVVFIEFCGIVIWNLIPQQIKRIRIKSTNNDLLQQGGNESVEYQLDDGEKQYTRYRDSVFA